MDDKLNEKYHKTHFSPEILRMFYEILNNEDPLALEALEAVYQKNQSNQPINIGDLADSIQTTRKVRKLDKETNTVFFEKEPTSLNRKHAERIVEKLKLLSFIYLKPTWNTKILYVTSRGNQLLQVHKYTQQHSKSQQ